MDNYKLKVLVALSHLAIEVAKADTLTYLEELDQIVDWQKFEELIQAANHRLKATLIEQGPQRIK